MNNDMVVGFGPTSSALETGSTKLAKAIACCAAACRSLPVNQVSSRTEVLTPRCDPTAPGGGYSEGWRASGAESITRRRDVSPKISEVYDLSPLLAEKVWRVIG